MRITPSIASILVLSATLWGCHGLPEAQVAKGGLQAVPLAEMAPVCPVPSDLEGFDMLQVINGCVDRCPGLYSEATTLKGEGFILDLQSCNEQEEWTPTLSFLTQDQCVFNYEEIYTDYHNPDDYRHREHSSGPWKCKNTLGYLKRIGRANPTIGVKAECIPMETEAVNTYPVSYEARAKLSMTLTNYQCLVRPKFLATAQGKTYRQWVLDIHTGKLGAKTQAWLEDVYDSIGLDYEASIQKVKELE